MHLDTEDPVVRRWFLLSFFLSFFSPVLKGVAGYKVDVSFSMVRTEEGSHLIRFVEGSGVVFLST